MFSTTGVGSGPVSPCLEQMLLLEQMQKPAELAKKKTGYCRKYSLQELKGGGKERRTGTPTKANLVLKAVV